MASTFSDCETPAFTQLVVSTMRTLFPEELAQRSWDNVGLLMGNATTSGASSESARPVVFLTNDLTFVVGEEAIARGASVVITYHPIIFSPLKSLTTNDPQQATLLRLASHGIAVYSPHTALDAAPRGINTWLGRILTAELDRSVRIQRSVIQPLERPPAGFEGAGYGLRLIFDPPQPITLLLQSVKALLPRESPYGMVAVPPGGTLDKRTKIGSVALCAGSGFDVVKNSNAELVFTGEMTHHNAQKLTQMGTYVVCVFHSNSERLFLKDWLQPQLENELRKELPEAQVIVSREDKDPFTIVDLRSLS